MRERVRTDSPFHNLASILKRKLKWDTPVIMLCDQTRRWHEYVRLKEAGTHEDILPSRKFEAEFDAASPSRQQAVREWANESTFLLILKPSGNRVHRLGMERLQRISYS